MFKVDFVGLVPWDILLMVLLGVEQQNSRAASFIALLKWMKLLRCYRIVWSFKTQEQYSELFSQLTVTLLRNLTYLFFMLHAAACMFW